MRKKRRWLGWLKWGCVAAVVVLIVGGAASGWRGVVYIHEVTPGRLTVMVEVSSGQFDLRRYFSGTLRPLGLRTFGVQQPGRLRWWPGYRHFGNLDRLTVPLWIIAALLAGVAGAAWRLEGRRAAGSGACPACGYNLRGLAAGEDGVVCPECGCTV